MAMAIFSGLDLGSPIAQINRHSTLDGSTKVRLFIWARPTIFIYLGSLYLASLDLNSWRLFGTQFQFQSPNCLKSELQVSTAKLSKDIKYVLNCISPSFSCLHIGLLFILEIFLVQIFFHFLFQSAIKKFKKIKNI